MASKYGFSDAREGLIEDLRAAYPTKWDNFVAARILGDDIFGLPKPHPNAILNLFLEQNVKFALPFAAYQACSGSSSALVGGEPDTVLPLHTLASIIQGMGVMKQLAAFAAHAMVYLHDLGVCPERSCVLNVGIDSAEGRRDALSRIFGAVFVGSECDLLSPLSLGTLVCVDCANRLERAHFDYRRKVVWTILPSLLGLESWEGV